MAHYIQAGVDKENAEKLKKHAKAEREKKINSFFEKITLRIQKRKQQREAAKAEKQKQEEFQTYCKNKYYRFLRMSRRDLWDYKEHGVRFDDCGNYLYISPADHGKIFERCILLRNLNAHCTQARSYEGFSPITVDGVEQMVYVFILEECYEGYDYGPHDDFHSPEKIIYSGFMRNLKGKFEEIYVDTSKNHDAILPKNTTKEDIINLYNYFIKSFDHILYEGKDGL